jgi:MoaA/NifB/PqqE/SkfB family radical SAM enzyme
MEPERQVEIQLGHMCNNRCVFCVSGQRTGLGLAGPMENEPILHEIQQARKQGHTKITLLGGEPTLQPGFLQIVEECVRLGFSEIVLFTNGAKTARAEFIDQILATGGNITWRISIQGATKASHDRTTQKPGSFDRILRTMEHLRQRKQRITVNMCVVQSNYEDVDHFPELLLPYGVNQLHLDMVRPLDAGERTDDELRATIPRYSELTSPFSKMVAGFPEGFDVNIGNVPYCIAPHLTPWIHHDGQMTETISIDGDQELSKPWNKYLIKRRDKVKPDTCQQCVFHDRCSGVFEHYYRYYGFQELQPIDRAKLEVLDPTRHFFTLHLSDLKRKLQQWKPPPPFDLLDIRDQGEHEIVLTLLGSTSLRIALRPAHVPGAFLGFPTFGVHWLSAMSTVTKHSSALASLWEQLAEYGGQASHPLGDDSFQICARTVARRLRKLRDAAPFPDIQWLSVVLSKSGTRADLVFQSKEGEQVELWLTEVNGKAGGGYRVSPTEPSPTLVASLRAILQSIGIGGERPPPRIETNA